ncbi:polyprenyl synthetase family protein [Conexibacter sp. DBS9H8]|uniref:polyprenyl synthetase family protein n=1 Tax=Conexibacter sp. DBS9H8 TaxID=2937801 RepID=UPI00200C6326|nr:polyprenyl synthetase family protein [Conexibacter sp. DBS9H8]
MSADPAVVVGRVTESGGDGAASVLAAAETRMLALTAQFGPTLGRHGAETIRAGGKRLRPLLVCLASGVPVRESDALVRAACAVELIHSATLVHDDVLDGADLRRGRPTVVSSGGRLAATATGDLLFSRAFADLAAGGSVAAVRSLADAARALAAGELLQRADAWDLTVTVERYLERCRLKTAKLFRAACELGGLAVDARADRIAALGLFGESIGLAFQLFDDVLDVTGPPERTGKPRGADLLDGTVTLPLILARERAGGLGELDLRGVSTAEAAARVCDEIIATGVLDAVRTDALGLVRTAKAQLPVLPRAQRDALELVADQVVERYR